MNIWQFMPQNFFSLLSSKNKHIYFGCIVEAFKIYEEGSILGTDKKIIVEVLVDYLDKNPFKLEENETNQEINTNREKANFILRKMEECGWIDIDVTNDYIEILNFREYAIILIEALMQMTPLSYDYEEEGGEEYRGYIYTIYSLLTNENNVEYGLMLEQVYRNTKLFIRELRKLDSRLKEYIKDIVITSDIKDLMNNLISYKTNLVDKAYYRLKTSDNVNKYRSEIVKRLEKFLNNDSVMDIVISSYQFRYKDLDTAANRAFRDMTEIIDIFNSLDNIILEIDVKNKTYINSTIGKIQFLLNDEDDVSGKITQILKYIALMHKDNKIDTAINQVTKIFKINSTRNLTMDSLYTPRGAYRHNEPQRLDLTDKDIFDIQKTFFEEYQTPYSEKLVLEYIAANLIDNALYASSMIKYDSPLEDILMMIYALIYADSDLKSKYRIIKLETHIEHMKFRMNDFIILKED